MRLFVGVWPPAEVVAQIGALPRPPRPRLRYTSEDQWHVTLTFLGEVDPAQVGPVAEAVAAAAGSVTGPVAVSAGPVVERLGRHVLCVAVHGLDEVAAAVRRETAGFRPGPPARPFHGHLTLARGVGASPVPAAAAGASCDTCWTVEWLSLVHSELHPDGARYRDLRRAHLGGGPTIQRHGDDAGR